MGMVCGEFRMKTPMDDDNLNAPPKAAPLTRADIATIMTGLMIAMFPGALDTTIVAPAMPTIARELGDAEHLPWIVTAYLLVSTAATPLYGKLSDIHGRRIMLLVAISIFALGSVLCALAPTMITLALARAVQALGGGGLVSVAMTVVGDIIPPRERVRYQVYTSIMWTTASLMGPVLGGWFAEKWHWSWMFWINLPLCLLAWLVTDSKLKRLPRHERPHQLDFIGAFLLVAGSVLFQLALSWGGSRYPWNSTPILGLFAGTAIMIGLLIQRLRTAREPLIPYTLLSNKIVLTGSASVGMAMGVYIALSVYLPVYFESVRGFSASQSGLALLPLMMCPTIGAVAAGRAMARVRRYKIVPLIGLGLSAAALLPMFFWPRDLSMATIEILLTLVAIGVGAVFPVTTVSVQNSVAMHELGTATSLVTFARNLGSALGVAIFGVIVIGGDYSPSGASGALGNKDLANLFSWTFLAGSLGFLLALTAMSRMEERPLRERSGQLEN